MEQSFGGAPALVFETPDLDLGQTLRCGQSFRWKELSRGLFEGAASDRPCRAALSDGRLSLWCDGDAAFWRGYFDLDADYARMRALFSKTPALAAACRWAGGIRILRQDGWEALASFIISQNNHIKRIEGIVQRLCESFGDPIGPGLFSFPRPERLAGRTAADLETIRCGFRARYLIDAADRVCAGEVRLEALTSLPLSEARAMLTRIAGVGPKVADCALLFGFHRLECFPVDVWIARAMRELLPDGLPKEILPCAGVAQQMLFHYMRTCPERRDRSAG